MKYQLVGPPIPPKPLLSYVLYLFPFLLLFRPLRTLIALWGLKNCSQVDFEPGFRYYYGNNIHAENVFLGNTFVEDYAQIDIGAGTAFSKDNKLITGTHDLYDRRKIIAKPIKIGKNVWITTNCIILPGVKIGDNSVIGAGSVVSRDIPANCVAAGNPCKVIRHLDKHKAISVMYP